MKNKNKTPKNFPSICKIKRNGKKYNFLAPFSLGKIGAVGYGNNSFGPDSKEARLLLPVEAIKRLLRSYFEDIKACDEEAVYFMQVGSMGMRYKDYANIMLFSLEEQLDKLGHNGKEIIDGVFNDYFKADYEKMNKFVKEQAK